jgi:pSer/pThr/pTyr-binding forkhead associated (FHA) protein
MATEAQSYGGLSLVKKDGSHSQRFQLVQRRYLFGRAEYCDIRINLHTVSREHAEIVVDEKDQVWVNSLSKTSDTNVCNKPVDGKILLKHNDLLEIGQRKFIFHANNIPEKLPGSASKGTNGKDAADVGKVQTARSKTGVLREIVNTPPGTMRARLAAKDFAFSPTKKEKRVHKGGMNDPDQRDQQCEIVSLDLTGNVSKGPTIAKVYRELEGGERTCVPDLKEKMLVEAFAEAQCIIDQAHSEAKNIIARAEADEQRTACGNTNTPLFYNQAQEKDVLLSLQSTQSTKRIEEQDPRGMSSTAMKTTSAHSPRKNLRKPPQSSMAKAERCLAFFDKMVCLNFLAATEHLTETVVQYSTEEWKKILQQAGFSAEDITEILQLLIEDDEDIKIDQKETKGVSAISHLPTLWPCGDRIQCHAALGSLAYNGFPAEGTPSMPATSLVPHLHPQIISDLSVFGQKTDLDSGRKKISPVKMLSTQNVEQGAETPSSPSIRLHPSIRKHPILNWLKKYDPTKDDTLVKNKVDYARNANGSSSNLILDHQTMDWTCPPPTGLWTFSPRKQTLFSPRLY